MKLAKVIGNVVATKKVTAFNGEKLLLIQPIDENDKEINNILVATEVAQAGIGDKVFYETGKEAAFALRDSFNPSDATILGIIDQVNN